MQNEYESRIAELERLLEEERSQCQAAQHELQSFRALAEAIPVGIALADANGHISYGNSALSQMVRHEIHHSKDTDSYGEWVAFHADGRKVESHEYPLARVLREELETSTLDVQYERGDGSRFWMRIIGEQVTDEAGTVTGAVVATVDIDAEKRLENEQRIMIAELNHRVKNAFTVSQSIVNRILRSVGSDPALIKNIDLRLKAYSAAHSKLVGLDWERVPLAELAHDILDPIASERCRINGPELVVPARTGLALSMAFYELATNAVKHGSLSQDSGQVDLSWTLTEDFAGEETWQIIWSESGGPPISRPQGEGGFGTFITGRAIMMETRGTVQTDWSADGFVWSLEMPAPYEEGMIA